MKVGDRVKLKSTNSWASPVVAGVITKIDHQASCLNHKVYLSTALDGTHHEWYSRKELLSLESEEEKKRRRKEVRKKKEQVTNERRKSRIRTALKEQLFEDALIFSWGFGAGAVFVFLMEKL